MKRLFTILVVLVVVVVGAAFVLPMVVPSSVYKSQLTQQVEAATGRELTIDGKVRFSLFPSAQIEMGKVKLANAPGAKSSDMVAMDQLAVNVGLLPLLSGTLDVKQFVLIRPDINLEVDENGKPNWEFETAAAGEPGTGSEPGSPGGSEAGGGAPGLGNVSLGDVRLEDGSLSYINRQTGDRHEVEQINLKLALQDIDSPFEADGSLTYEDETLVLRTKIDQPRAIVEGGNTPLTLTVRSNVVSLALDGQASGGEEVSIGGKTDLNVPSVRGLAAWLGAEVPMEQGFNELDIQGQLNAKADTIAFTDATLAFDEINGTGAITLATGGSVPSVTGGLAVDILDLRPYSGASQGAPGGGGPAGGPGGSPPASEEWSNDPIDFSGLKAMNADLDLSANQIFVDAFEIGKSVLAVTVKDGVLTTNLSELALYEGVGKGTLTVDGRRRNAVIRTNLSLTGVQSQPIVKALMDKDFLAGAGKIEFNLTTSGNSQRQFMRALDGRGQVFLQDGKINGVDLVNILKAVDDLGGRIASGDLQFGEFLGANSTTDFVEFGGNFTVENGVVTNDDLKLINDLVSLSGAGTINLPKQNLDYRVDPGQSQDDGGLNVSLGIDGPWTNLSFKPAVGDALKKDIQSQIGEKLGIEEDSQAGKILKGLFGNN